MFPLLPPYPAAEGLAARVAFILRTAMVYVASRVRQPVPGLGPAIIPVRFEHLINGWLERRRKAIVALIERIEAGRQAQPRPYRAREGTPRARGPMQPGVRLPTPFFWLGVIGRELGNPGRALAALLEGEMREMVTAHPQLARLIRPLLRMLGQVPPVWFPKAPPRTKRAKRAGGSHRRERRPAGDARADATSLDLARFIDVQAAKQYADDMKRVYGACGGLPPAVAKHLAAFARRAARWVVAPAAAPAPAPVPLVDPAPAPAEAPLDRERYYYAETWNGKLIPVRRRWG
jgi:hypothetical protein